VAREVTTGILARYAHDQPTTLVKALVDANPGEFRLLLAALGEHAAEALPPLRAVADQEVDGVRLSAGWTWDSNVRIERAWDAAERRRTNALAAQWRLGDSSAALAALRRQSDPALRAWLIEQLSSLGVTTEELMSLANSTADNGVRQALLLALGQS